MVKNETIKKGNEKTNILRLKPNKPIINKNPNKRLKPARPMRVRILFVFF